MWPRAEAVRKHIDLTAETREACACWDVGAGQVAEGLPQCVWVVVWNTEKEAAVTRRGVMRGVERGIKHKAVYRAKGLRTCRSVD